MAENNDQLILESVHVWCGNTLVLRGIDWRVKSGEHWAVLGANGSGKTSLILTVSGYLRFGRGRLYLIDGWLGQIHLPTQKQKVGVLSQPLAERVVRSAPRDTALDVVLSGLLASIGLTEDIEKREQEKARQILAEFGQEHLAESLFSQLSTGEKQACMLARSWMAESQLILLDEPCAGLDLAARERFLGHVSTLLQDPKAPTTILVTHHPEEIVPQVSHVLLLKQGRQVAAGPKDEVMTDHALSETFGLDLEVSVVNGRYLVQGSASAILPRPQKNNRYE